MAGGVIVWAGVKAVELLVHPHWGSGRAGGADMAGMMGAGSACMLGAGSACMLGV